MARIYQCHPNSVECFLSDSALCIFVDEVPQVDSALRPDIRDLVCVIAVHCSGVQPQLNWMRGFLVRFKR
jgi:hypothetical protein